MSLIVALTPRSTWWTAGGDVVQIVGLAQHAPVGDLRVFWALSGRWYLEDGRPFSPALPVDSFAARDRIVREDRTADARKYWERFEDG